MSRTSPRVSKLIIYIHDDGEIGKKHIKVVLIKWVVQFTRRTFSSLASMRTHIENDVRERIHIGGTGGTHVIEGTL